MNGTAQMMLLIMRVRTGGAGIMTPPAKTGADATIAQVEGGMVVDGMTSVRPQPSLPCRVAQ